MNKTLKKALALALCAVFLVVGTISGTMAYLTFTTETVTNTFTFGEVGITLDETDVDLYGVKDGDTRVKTNTYKLIPGKAYVKDPKIHVEANSESCWLFVKVENGIEPIEAGGNTTIKAQMDSAGWVLLADAQEIKDKISDNTITAASVANVWAHKRTTQNSSYVQDIPVFDRFVLCNDSEKIASYKDENVSIKITAYAVQAEGFETAADAWLGAPSTWTIE